jgi:primary-amine oxidase
MEAAASSHPHPLDPLSAAELMAVRTTVLASPLVPTRPLHFHYVGLDEPNEAAVLSYASIGASFTSTVLLPWHALVIARVDGQSHELLVDVSDASAPSVLSHAVHHGAGFPMKTMADQVTAMALPPMYPPFVESVQKAG